MADVPLVFCDTETTELSFARQTWEIAAIRDNPDGTTERYHMFLPVYREDDWSMTALNIGHFHDRYPGGKLLSRYEKIEDYPYGLTLIDKYQDTIQHIFRDSAHFVGMVPDFDALNLWRLLGVNKKFPWYYQLIDVDMMALGYFARDSVGGDVLQGFNKLPVDTDAISAWLGISISDDERHTAMGDTVWTRKIYYTLMNAQVPNG